jgi:hypothetical protein
MSTSIKKYNLWQALFKNKVWYQAINLALHFKEIEK